MDPTHTYTQNIDVVRVMIDVYFYTTLPRFREGFYDDQCPTLIIGDIIAIVDHKLIIENVNCLTFETLLPSKVS